MVFVAAASSPAFAGVSTEPQTDRPGADYERIALPAADPALCRASCETDARCTAYTYVKPGVQGRNAVCYLKNAVPDAVTSDCCVSGPGGVDAVIRRECLSNGKVYVATERFAAGRLKQERFSALAACTFVSTQPILMFGVLDAGARNMQAYRLPAEPRFAPEAPRAE